MISLEEIKEKLDEANEMMEEYNKQDLKWDKNWKPEKGDKYCYIDIYNEIVFESNEYYSDEIIIKYNRIFQTEEQAEKWLEIDTYLREKSFEPDWNNGYQRKYTLIFKSSSKKFQFDLCWSYNSFAPFYFESEGIIEEILKKYSNEELEFYFEIGG